MDSHSDNHRPYPEDHDEGHSHDEPWLVSYADMMTLLFGFFVLMYSFAAKQNSSEEFERVKKELAKQFGAATIEKSENQKTMEFIREILGNSTLKNSYTIVAIEHGIEVNLTSGLLFDAGKAELVEYSKKPMTDLINFLLSKKDSILIEVEGHTDDSPIYSEKFPSNWELSGARSATVLKMFLQNGFDGNSLRGMLYGDQRPVAPNRDLAGERVPENQARNRRVVIRILNKSTVEKKVITPDNVDKQPSS